MSSDEPDPAVVVELDDRWIALPVRADDDAGDWASDAVAQALQRRGWREPAAVTELYVQSYALLLERLRQRRDGDGDFLAAAYALVSQDDLLPVTAAELWGAGTELNIEQLADGLVLDRGERFGDPVIDELTSPAGDAIRLKQYVIVGVAGCVEQSVQISVVYLWPGPVSGTTVLLTAWFPSVADGELYESDLEALASSLAFEPA